MYFFVASQYFRRTTYSTIVIPGIHNTIALFFVAQALDKDSGAYGSVLYSIVNEEVPGFFSLGLNTGEVALSNLSAQVTGKLHYTLSVSAADNLEKVPYHRANQNASVHVRLFLLLLLLLHLREQLAF